MSKKVLLREATLSHRRQPLLRQSESYRKAGTRLGEAVGGTAAVCCCCPCGLANVMYLALIKVPARLCQKALKKKRRRQLQSMEEGQFPSRRCSCGCCEDIIGFRIYPMCGDDDVAIFKVVEKKDKEVLELEKEMWDRFYSTGFWRSPSQRDGFASSQRIVSASNLEVLSV